MRERPDLKTISDDKLLHGLFEILKKTRHDETDLVAHIAEVDARKLYARQAAPSMFAYCTEVLHLSEPEAALRIRVARVSRRHPAVLTMLRDGKIHLSGIALLAPLLTRANRDALLERATHKSKRQIQEIVAELVPQPGVAATMRKLPARREDSSGAAVHSQCPDAVGAPRAQRPGAADSRYGDCHTPRLDSLLNAAASPAGEQRPDTAFGPWAGVSQDQSQGLGTEQRPDAVAGLKARTAKVEPLAPARFKVQFTADAEFRDELERLQALTRPAVPDGDLGKVIRLAVTRELARLEARRFGKAKKPRKRLAQTDTRPKSRHIPAAVRRFVAKRDGGRCAYRDKHGRRCTKRHDLEFHHRKPFSLGGDHGPEGLALMCRAHNALLAEQDFGKEKMARYRRRASRVSEATAVLSRLACGQTGRATQGGGSPSGSTIHAPLG